jgi:hypothetical protein
VANEIQFIDANKTITKALIFGTLSGGLGVYRGSGATLTLLSATTDAQFPAGAITLTQETTMTNGTGTGLFRATFPAALLASAGTYFVLAYDATPAPNAHRVDIPPQILFCNGTRIVDAYDNFAIKDLAIPSTGNVAHTLADCLNAARAQGFGKWAINRTTKVLTLYASDNVTVVTSFLLDSVTAPSTRTPQ